MTEKKSALVIFDLDETLIHSRQEPLPREPDYKIEPLSIYRRPFATELIAAAARNFEVAVWSAGSPLYVDTIVDLIFPIEVNPLFVFNRDDCVRRFEISFLQTLFLKDLNRAQEFGFDLGRTLIVEDDPVKVKDFPDNAIIVSQYFGDDGDEELSRLIRFIEGLDSRISDLRTVNKKWKGNSSR